MNFLPALPGLSQCADLYAQMIDLRSHGRGKTEDRRHALKVRDEDPS